MKDPNEIVDIDRSETPKKKKAEKEKTWLGKKYKKTRLKSSEDRMRDW